MRQFAPEIEADLLFRGIDLTDWHQGRMSSRRLLVLVSALPADSAFAKAAREGDWSLEEYLRAATVNELRSLRVDQAALQGQQMDMSFVESPRQVEEREEDFEAKQQIRLQIVKQLTGGEESSDV